MTSSRRTNEPSPLEVEGSTAGATGAGDLEEMGEQCIYCLRFTYEPGYGCLACGKGLQFDEVNRE